MMNLIRLLVERVERGGIKLYTLRGLSKMPRSNMNRDKTDCQKFTQRKLPFELLPKKNPPT
jgi:hypothetical protein